MHSLDSSCARFLSMQVGRPASVNAREAEAQWSKSQRTVDLAMPVDMQHQVRAARQQSRNSRGSSPGYDDYDTFVDDPDLATQRARLAEDDARARLAEAERKRRSVEAAVRRQRESTAAQAREEERANTAADEQKRRDWLSQAARQRRDSEQEAKLREAEYAAAMARRKEEAAIRARKKEVDEAKVRDAAAAERARAKNSHQSQANGRHTIPQRSSSGGIRSEDVSPSGRRSAGGSTSSKVIFHTPPPPAATAASRSSTTNGHYDEEDDYEIPVRQTAQVSRSAPASSSKLPAEPFYSTGQQAVSSGGATRVQQASPAKPRTGRGRGAPRSGSLRSSDGVSPGQRISAAHNTTSPTALSPRQSSSAKNVPLRGAARTAPTSKARDSPDPTIPSLEAKISKAKAKRASRTSSVVFDGASTSETDVAIEPPAPPASVAPDVTSASSADDDQDRPEPPSSAPPDLSSIPEPGPEPAFDLPRLITINLTKNSKGLGIELKGFMDAVTKKVALVIDVIRPASAAAVDGRLQVGEQIVEINRRKVSDMEAQEIQRFLARSENSISVSVLDSDGRPSDDDKRHSDALIEAATRSPDELDDNNGGDTSVRRIDSNISRDTNFSANSQRLLVLATAKPPRKSQEHIPATQGSRRGQPATSSQPAETPGPSAGSLREQTPASRSTPTKSSTSTAVSEKTVTLVRSSYATLWGFSLGKDAADKLVIVSVNSPGLAYGKLLAGDQVLAVNEMPLSEHLNDDFVKNKMKSSKKLVLKVLRGCDPTLATAGAGAARESAASPASAAGDTSTVTLRKTPASPRWGVAFDTQDVSAGLYMHVVKNVDKAGICRE
jgi:hypothetical protein